LKHLKPISNRKPGQADAFQDAACAIILMLSTFFGFLGANAPGLDYLDSKCRIPTPND